MILNICISCISRVSLQIECFLLIYYLNGFKFRINRHLLFRFLLNRFHVCFNLFVLLFLVTPMPCSGCSALHSQFQIFLFMKDWTLLFSRNLLYTFAFCRSFLMNEFGRINEFLQIFSVMSRNKLLLLPKKS